MSNDRILPDGTATKSDREYVDAWREFTKPLAKILDAHPFAYDPGVTYRKKGYSFELDHEVVQLINQELTRYKEVEVAVKALLAEYEGMEEGDWVDGYFVTGLEKALAALEEGE